MKMEERLRKNAVNLFGVPFLSFSKMVLEL